MDRRAAQTRRRQLRSGKTLGKTQRPSRCKEDSKEVTRAIKRLQRNDRKVGLTAALCSPHAGLKLVELNLGGRAITLRGFRMLGEALKSNTNLEHLLLYDTGICVEGMRALARGLLHNTSVQALNLGENQLALESVEILVLLLEKNCCISSL